MKITNNFTLEELTRTSCGLDNTPSEEAIANLQMLCTNVLQPLREKYGKTIIVNSGYRSPAVNKAVGGAVNSQHTKGEAADISAGSKELNRVLFGILEKMDFDQLIDEKNMSWIHVSYREGKNRKQKLKL